jgi:hypothetical protein
MRRNDHAAAIIRWTIQQRYIYDASNVKGSTIGASLDDVSACGISSSSASGVWYTVRFWGSDADADAS